MKFFVTRDRAFQTCSPPARETIPEFGSQGFVKKQHQAPNILSKFDLFENILSRGLRASLSNIKDGKNAGTIVVLNNRGFTNKRMKELLQKHKQYLLNGVSYVIPFIAGGGILITVALT